MTNAMSEKKKRRFSKAVVAYCLAVCTVITAVTLAICWRTGELNSGIVATLCGLWGGELLLLCVKRVTDAGTVKKAQTPADAAREEKGEKDGDRI